MQAQARVVIRPSLIVVNGPLTRLWSSSMGPNFSRLWLLYFFPAFSCDRHRPFLATTCLLNKKGSGPLMVARSGPDWVWRPRAYPGSDTAAKQKVASTKTGSDPLMGVRSGPEWVLLTQAFTVWATAVGRNCWQHQDGFWPINNHNLNWLCACSWENVAT